MASHERSVKSIEVEGAIPDASPTLLVVDEKVPTGPQWMKAHVFLRNFQGDCGANDDVLKQSNGEEKVGA